MKAMLTSALLCTLLACTFALDEDDTLVCSRIRTEPKPEWADMSNENQCIKIMRRQIQEEIKASMKYLAWGSHFSRDTVNRPGFAKMFFEAASEERQHAIKLISYLLMRGELTSDVSTLIKPHELTTDLDNDAVRNGTRNGAEALRAALNLETEVTKLIRALIVACEKEPNDYHLVDYLTGEFLEEQYRGQRDIAGKLSTLKKMLDDHKALGEFLFDKKLLNGEL